MINVKDLYTLAKISGLAEIFRLAKISGLAEMFRLAGYLA